MTQTSNLDTRAVHYHFGNVEGLVKETFAERFAAIAIERMKRFELEELVDRASLASLQTISTKLMQFLPNLPPAILLLRIR
ncbi:MAG: hypothetical protein AAF251_04155 [Pseudomonadota bacterium]